MRASSLGFAVLLVAGALARAADTPVDAPRYEMAVTQLALLSTSSGAKPLGEREIQSIQEGHLRYLRELAESGKLVVEGPIHQVPQGGSLRSVLVLDVPSPEDAQALLAKDPWIAGKQLVAEVHPWWSAKGILRKPAQLDRPALCYLGLLRRPPDAPTFPKEKLDELQKGHMANIERMAASKDLVIAGPIGDDTALRGIFVFRTTDPDRIRELVAADPAIQAGRLRLELFGWYVPQGVVPPE